MRILNVAAVLRSSQQTEAGEHSPSIAAPTAASPWQPRHLVSEGRFDQTIGWTSGVSFKRADFLSEASGMFSADAFVALRGMTRCFRDFLCFGDFSESTDG